MKQLVLAACLSSALLSSVSAQPFVQAEFSNGNEGWTIVDWNGAGNPVVPTWNLTGGNPGGYIRGADVHSDGFWRAPAFLGGNWSSAYGGTLSYDAFAKYNDWKMNEVYIVGTAGTLSYWFANNPTAQWQTFSTTIDVQAGWQFGLHYDKVGPMASEAQIRAVLDEVTELRIREEYGWGTDDSGLDNVLVMPPDGFRRPQVSIQVNSSYVTVTCSALRTGQTYTVEQTSSPGSSAWEGVRTFVASSPTHWIGLPLTNSVMYYRAVATRE